MGSMSLQAVGLQGSQSPTFEHVPDFVSSAGREAVELAALAGLFLDPWQQHVLERSLGERPDGKWAAFEVGLVVPRQNGKGSVLEARELAGLFLLGERLIIHSAHLFDTSLEAYRRLRGLIEDTPDLARRVRRFNNSHGQEGIELRNGQRIRFRARTRGGGRGFTADCLVLDEAMFLPEATLGALLPTLSARPNSQVWYAGSAVDQLVHPEGLHLARVRQRGRDAAGSLAYFEWSVRGADTPSDLSEQDAASPEAQAQANPGLGIRIGPGHVENERQAFDHRMFCVERLGVGDWPDPAGAQTVVDLPTWDMLADKRSKPSDPVVFSFDVMPDRSWASIGVAGSRPDGRWHVEIVDRRRGTGWIANRVAELVEAHAPLGVVCDGAGPAGSLLPELQERGIEPVTVTAVEHAQACARFFDGVAEKTIRHLGDQAVRAAIKGAARRPLGDAWAWSRKQSTVDISPLVACTLALWLASTGTEQKPSFLLAVDFG